MSLTVDFWWRKKSDTKPVHWVSKKWLLEDKLKGGMNFKDFECFNLAMVAKVGWKFMKYPDSLVSRFFKCIYFPESTFMSASIGTRPSYIWRGLIKARDVVLKNAVVQENNGVRWIPNGGCDFNVKSAYQVAVRCIRRMDIINGEQSDESNLKRFWRRLWSLPVPKKIKIFGWRAYHTGLPVGIILQRRLSLTDVGCPVCGFIIETESHIFFECWWAKSIWDKSGLQFNVHNLYSLSIADWLFWIFQHMDVDQCSSALVILWLIWYNRNITKFQNEVISPARIFSKSKLLLKDFELSRVCTAVANQSFHFEWQKPPVGFVKINVDAAWCKNSGEAAIAVIVRDHIGHILNVCTIYLEHCDSAFEAEGKALQKATDLAVQKDFKKVLFESDCLILVQAMKNPYELGVISSGWFSDCCTKFQINSLWSLWAIYREANYLADAVAKRCLSSRCSWTCLEACPRFIQHLL